MSQPRFGFVRSASLVALALGIAGSSIAYGDDPPTTPPAKDGSPNGGPNGGKQKRPGGEGNPPRTPPEGVKGDQKPGAERPGGGQRGPGRGMPQMYMKAFHELKLSDEQKTKADAIFAAWQKKEDEFQKASGEKIKALEEKRKEEVKKDGKASEETLKALKDSLAGRPKFEDASKQADALLNPDQKKELEEKTAKMRERGRGGDNPKRGGDGAGKDGAGKDGAGKDGAGKRDRGPAGGGTGGGTGGGAPTNPKA